MTHPTPTELQLSFLGGATGIGGSATLLCAGDARVLVDCGVRLTGDSRLPDLAPLSGQKLDAIFLTHAHTDHSGALPVVCEAFPATPVYATPPTLDLTAVLLRDALRLMGSSERDQDIPLYSQKQVDRIADSAVPMQVGDSVAVGPVTATFLPAGHILGAAMLHLATPAGTAAFTGDYSVTPQRTVPGLSRPSVDADLVVTESTYGSRLHEDRQVAETRLVSRLREVLVEQKGRALIPAFAIGRAQEVLLILKSAIREGLLPEVPVFVDGMVRSVCDIYAAHERYVSRALLHEIHHGGHAFYDAQIQPVRTQEQRAKALQTRPCVYVASSGMLSGGASVVYAQSIAPNMQDAILITGYQDEESPGRALLRLCEEGAEAQEAGPRRIRLGAELVDARCGVGKYSLSAHADRLQMAGVVEAFRPRTVVLVHGDSAAKEDLAGSLECGDIVQANDGDVLTRQYPARSSLRKRPQRSGPLDFATAQRLLGPALDRPIAIKQIAAAFFGGTARREDREALADELEAMGLARRDDTARHMLWVLAPQESPAPALVAEAKAIGQIKAENPKGRLLEFCMRASVDAPVLEELGTKGHHFMVRMTMTVDGVLLDSGPQRAAGKKAVEQVAANALLEQLRELDARRFEGAQVELVDATETGPALRAENPKGRVLELCAQARLSAPDFEQRPRLEGFCVRATWRTPEGAVWSSPWCQSTDIKVAEQAAAARLLAEMRASNGARPSGATKASAEAQPQPQPQPTAGPSAPVDINQPDPRPILNQMRQQGVLLDFGYELVSQAGAQHQPIFVMQGWALLRSQERVTGGAVKAPSKKRAEQESAKALFVALQERGFVQNDER
jgi:Cft2 family RNA processing exonuclease/dsRNA-specific ribonuclease